jgi:hypothetical protein
MCKSIIDNNLFFKMGCAEDPFQNNDCISLYNAFFILPNRPGPSGLSLSKRINREAIVLH